MFQKKRMWMNQWKGGSIYNDIKKLRNLKNQNNFLT